VWDNQYFIDIGNAFVGVNSELLHYRASAALEHAKSWALPFFATGGCGCLLSDEYV